MIRRHGRPSRSRLAALLLLAGCATPALSPLPPEDPRPAALLARWSSQLSGRDALRGSARLSVDAGEDLHVRSKQRIVVARPARLRVEVQGLFGTTLAVLAVDEDEYAFFEAEGHRFESGPVHPGLLWEMVRLDLTPNEAVELLLGAPELPAGLRILSAQDAGDGQVRLLLGSEDGAPRRSVDLDDQATLRRYVVFSPAGGPVWSADLDDYGDVGGRALAHRVTIETGDGARAVVTLDRLELNPPLAAGMFRIDGVRPAAGSEGEGG